MEYLAKILLKVKTNKRRQVVDLYLRQHFFPKAFARPAFAPTTFGFLAPLSLNWPSCWTWSVANPQSPCTGCLPVVHLREVGQIPTCHSHPISTIVHYPVKNHSCQSNSRQSEAQRYEAIYLRLLFLENGTSPSADFLAAIIGPRALLLDPAGLLDSKQKPLRDTNFVEEKVWGRRRWVNPVYGLSLLDVNNSVAIATPRHGPCTCRHINNWARNVYPELRPLALFCSPPVRLC